MLGCLEAAIMNDLTLWAGHIDYHKSGRLRGRGTMEYLKVIFDNAIIGWLPNGDDHPSRAYGQIRSEDGMTILSTANYINNKWEWTS